jgi:uncharacterized protein YcnI
MKTLTASAIALAALSISSADAHVTLENTQAPTNSYYKATFSVPHGCEGTPTVRLRIRIPDGITSVKPQPKIGWELAITKEKLEKPMVIEHGVTITEIVREVSWSGGRLPDEYFDQFAMQVKLPDAPNTTMYFPAVQECEKGVHRWIEIPEAGKTARDYKEPAPSVRLMPVAMPQ